MNNVVLLIFEGFEMSEKSDKKPCVQKRIGMSIKRIGRCKVLIFLVSIVLVFLFLNPMNPRKFDASALDDEEVDDGRFIANANRDSILFWGVIFLTCVVGIVELLQLEPRQGFKYWLVFVFYVALLILMVQCMSKGWDLYRENYELTDRGKLGKEIKDHRFHPSNLSLIDKHKDIIFCEWFEASFIIGVIVFFESLFFEIFPIPSTDQTNGTISPSAS